MSVVELSPYERPRSLWMVLFAPTGAFLSARARPRPWLTLLAVLGFAALPPLMFVLVVDMHDFLLAELKASGRLEDMPQEALAFLKDTLAPAMQVGLPLFTAGMRAASILVVAALGFGFLRALAKDLSFKACLAAVALGAAPLVLHDVVSAFLLASRDLSSIDARNPVLSNPAAWLSLHVEEDPLGALLRGLDLFQLWAAWLSAYALNVVARTRSLLPYLLTYGGLALATLAAVTGALASGAASSL